MQYTIFVILPMLVGFFTFSLTPSADFAYINRIYLDEW